MLGVTIRRDEERQYPSRPSLLEILRWVSSHQYEGLDAGTIAFCPLE